MGITIARQRLFLIRVGIVSLFTFLSFITAGKADDRTIVNRKYVADYVFGNCLYNIDTDKHQEDIQFVLVKGTMTEYDVAAGAFTEYGFVGDMELRVVKNAKTLDTYPIIPRNPNAITLPGGDHNLSCQDLNQDGNVDFPLRADWRSRSDYLIYSVSPTGKIALLPIHNRSGNFPMVDNKQTLSTKEITLEGRLLRVNNANYNSYLAKTQYKGYDEPQFNYFKWTGQAFAPDHSRNSVTSSSATVASSTTTASQVVRFLGGKQAGCPMYATYNPKIFSDDPAAAMAFANSEFADLIEYEGYAGIGKLTDSDTGRVWYVLSSFAPSCDPHFLFVSVGPSSKEKIIVNGEDLRVISSSDFSIRQRINLFLPIVHNLKFKKGLPTEEIPQYYPLKLESKTLEDTALYSGKDDVKPEKQLPANTPLEITGYFPGDRSISGRVLVQTTDNIMGWVDVRNGLLEGVEHRGD